MCLIIFFGIVRLYQNHTLILQSIYIRVNVTLRDVQQPLHFFDERYIRREFISSIHMFRRDVLLLGFQFP